MLIARYTDAYTTTTQLTTCASFGRLALGCSYRTKKHPKSRVLFFVLLLELHKTKH